jgi:hypothetical protein
MPDAPSPDSGLSDRLLNSALRATVSELETYRRRYGRISEPPELSRMELAVGRRLAKMEALRDQMAVLLDEISRLDDELQGYRKGYLALLEDTIDRVRRDHGEGWSPTPVLGYRLWSWRDGGIHGAWERWATPTKTATCRSGDDEIPHSDGRCGRLGCGVYAGKDLRALLEEHTRPGSHGYLAGSVELTGKVVEHEHGYRATRADVVTAVLVGADHMVLADDSAMLSDLFGAPDEIMERSGRPLPTQAWDSILEFVTPRERSSTWTSETRSE